jgi:zinc and cadmium transporter
MNPALLVAAYAALTLVGSLVGGWVPLMGRMSHSRTQLLMSVVAGLMLGVGVFHMLPHAYFQLHDLDRTVWWMMVGLLTTFFLQRFLHFHQHEPPDATDHDHGHDHSPHDHAHHHHGHSHPEGRKAVSWVGISLGLVLHTLMDGVALAAGVEADARSHGGAQWAGLGIFAAVFLHKPLDAMAVTTLMLRGGWSPRARHLANLAFALVCPLGAGLFYAGMGRTSAAEQAVVGCALAFSAGTFLCISLSDLLPELQFHSHDRVKLSAALLVGVALAWGIVFLEESGHDHHAPGSHNHPAGDGHDHLHSGHDHSGNAP